MSLNSSSYIQSFTGYLGYQKKYSSHTILSYQTDLLAFFDFVSHQYGDVSLEQISASIIRSWLASLKEDGIASKSINRKISTLKSFFKFLLRNDEIAASPMGTIVSLKVKKRLPSYIEQKEIANLFDHFENPVSWQEKTDQLLLKIFYQTGIRLSELINLKEWQIDKGNSAVKVTGKGNKERIIPVTNRLIKDIENYLEEKKRDITVTDLHYLLVNHRGKKLYPKYVYATVKSHLEKVTTNDRKSPHILRHSFATHLTGNGADINAVKELLGHSSLAATQIYTHNSIEKLKDVHRKAHPKA